MVATRSARFSRCVLRCQGSRSPSTALMLRAACSIPPIQTPNPSKNGPSSSRYPTVNHFRPKPIGGEAETVGNELDQLLEHVQSMKMGLIEAVEFFAVLIVGSVFPVYKAEEVPRHRSDPFGSR